MILIYLDFRPIVVDKEIVRQDISLADVINVVHFALQRCQCEQTDGRVHDRTCECCELEQKFQQTCENVYTIYMENKTAESDPITTQ